MIHARRPAMTVLTLLALLWLAVLIAAPLLGSHHVALDEILGGDATAHTILWRLRLPRVLLALLAGGALALAGLAFQTLFRNPLAEPYTLGVASGAALGAVVALRLQELGIAARAPLVALCSFAGAVAASSLVVGLASHRRRLETSTLLLAGVAVSLSCQAIILFLQYLADFTQTFRMVRWVMGGLAVVGYGDVVWLAPWVIVAAGLLLTRRWELNLLLLGEELAASRGVNLVRLRWSLLTAVSLMVGAMVAVTGPIGFVGLMVPHILRRIVGHDHLELVPACLLGGGVFLSCCDLAARTILAPAELPVGILTALLGGPFFLWLLLAGRFRRESGGLE